ncbi:site-specific integrase [Rhizorhabdus sp.]|uniref:site-specific integrase n=1 Tax=Rhizorhabdus sp. TaxID=1968843 RepID=UPI00199094D3|nr:site-specific integrase [Rhizorhabdus sp.]MBD3762337.1 site-specific integrase [Rhizorhabdus sp.]
MRQNYLTRRPGSSSVYYKRRYPLHLVETIGQKIFNKSTGKKTEAEAKTVLGLMEAQYRMVVAEAEQRLAAPVRLAPIMAKTIVSNRPTPMFPSAPSLPRLTDDQARCFARQYFDEQLWELDRDISDHASDREWEDELDWQIDVLGDPEHEETLRWTQYAAARILIRHGIAAEPWSGAGLLLSNLIRRAMLQLAVIRKARVAGDYSDEITDSRFRHSPPAPIEQVAAAAPTSSYPSVTFAELIAAYEHENEGETAKYTEKTKAKRKGTLNTLQRFFGADHQISEINRAACRRFRDTIAALPPNFTKSAPLDTPLPDLVRAVDDAGPTLKYATQGTYLDALSRLMRCAAAEELIRINPLAEPLRPRGEPVPAEDARDPYSLAQLKVIFSAPIYTGCVDDERKFSKPRPGNIIRRSRFWLPLIALFTGLRMGEILQLTRWHVQTGDDGLPCLLIGDDIRVKTKAAYRVVPLHETILKCGFMRYVESKSDELFEDVPEGSDGYKSSVFSKRYATFAASLKMDDPKLDTCFHSFRHNFRDALRIPDMDKALAKELFGHSRGGDVFDAYGSGARAEVLRPVIDRVTYDIDLSHLYAD